MPHRFSVLAAEVFHSLQTVHEHIETVARRKVIDSVVTLTPLAKSEFSMLTDLDNYAKHQALPIIGSVSSRGTAVVTDSLGQAVGSLSAVEAPTQAGDLVAAFEFDRDLAGVDTVRYDVNEVLVIGAAVFDRPSNLFDAMHKTFLQATHVSLPLLEWLNAHPERPPERRTGLGAPLPWVAPAAGKPTTPRA